MTAATISDGSFDGIIALGGDPERVIEAVRLAGRFPAAKLVIAGRGEERQHAYALANGIVPERLVIEPRSSNTFENAAFTGRILHPGTHSRWLLVTSPSHMPRAIGSFRKAGFDVTPWPATRTPQLHRHTWQTARHEWLGLLAYRVLGRTDALFPAPATKPLPGTAHQSTHQSKRMAAMPD